MQVSSEHSSSGSTDDDEEVKKTNGEYCGVSEEINGHCTSITRHVYPFQFVLAKAAMTESKIPLRAVFFVRLDNDCDNDRSLSLC